MDQNRNQGAAELTKPEQDALAALSVAWNAFLLAVPSVHDRRPASDAATTIQNILLAQAVRRANPDTIGRHFP